MRREYNNVKINVVPPIDGYTCWFDAIDNENTGTHNNNATTFYDRTGDFYLKPKQGSFIWDKNNVRIFNTSIREASGNPNMTFGLGSNDFTVMFVASFDEQFSTNDAGYVLGETFIYNPGTNRWILTAKGGNFVFMQHNGSSWNVLMRSSVSLEINKVYFVVFRRNYNNFSILVNGVNVATYYGNLSFNVQGSPKIAIIGASNKYYTGIVYKKYLSDSDINDMKVWLQSYYGVQL